MSELTTELGERAKAWLDLLRAARQAQKEAEADEETAKRNLAALLGDAEEGTIGGRRVCTRKTSVRATVNVDQLREEFPDAYEKCLRTTEVTTFRVTA